MGYKFLKTAPALIMILLIPTFSLAYQYACANTHTRGSQVGDCGHTQCMQAVNVATGRDVWIACQWDEVCMYYSSLNPLDAGKTSCYNCVENAGCCAPETKTCTANSDCCAGYCSSSHCCPTGSAWEQKLGVWDCYPHNPCYDDPCSYSPGTYNWWHSTNCVKTGSSFTACCGPFNLYGKTDWYEETPITTY